MYHTIILKQRIDTHCKFLHYFSVMPRDLVRQRERDRQRKAQKKVENPEEFMRKRREAVNKCYKKKMESMSGRDKRAHKRKKTEYQREWRNTKQCQDDRCTRINQTPEIQTIISSKRSESATRREKMKLRANMKKLTHENVRLQRLVWRKDKALKKCLKSSKNDPAQIVLSAEYSPSKTLDSTLKSPPETQKALLAHFALMKSVFGSPGRKEKRQLVHHMKRVSEI
jgi:hypothetical protein